MLAETRVAVEAHIAKLGAVIDTTRIAFAQLVATIQVVKGHRRYNNARLVANAAACARERGAHPHCNNTGDIGSSLCPQNPLSNYNVWDKLDSALYGVVEDAMSCVVYIWVITAGCETITSAAQCMMRSSNVPECKHYSCSAHCDTLARRVDPTHLEHEKVAHAMAAMRIVFNDQAPTLMVCSACAEF